MKTVLLLLCGIMLSKLVLAKNPDSTDTKRLRNFRSSVILTGSDPITQRPGLLSLPFFSDRTIGAYYQCQITKHFGVKIGASEWNSTPLYHLFRPSWETIQAGNYPITLESGSILNSFDYKFFFCYFQYIFSFRQRWKIYPEVGLSYTYGNNVVVDSVIWNTLPPYDGLIYSSELKAHYWGITPSLSVDYLCFWGRLRIGADVTYLKYFNFYFRETNIGFHAGFNF